MNAKHYMVTCPFQLPKSCARQLVRPDLLMIIPGGGGTHIFGQTGMCRSTGSLFYKKSLNMGPVFYQKSLNMGQFFWLCPNFWVFAWQKPQKSWNLWKILKNGYPFLPKSPLKMGRGFEAWVAHPCPTQIWVSPPPRLYIPTISN